ncbi:hypothetical protein K438DRAFT_1558347 [Mycena galopus ATCC 62051]|nr:hypothetical protein K438DRAFT_1558347 [Mycena galopus ATCC 62051]
MLLPLFYVLVLARAVSSVSLVNPIDNQLPGMARIGQSYSWSFSQSTFAGSNLQYRVSSDLPSWLSFDSSTRTFHGTPAAQDEGTPSIVVTAHDLSSSASSTFTICVTPFPPPTLHMPLVDQFYTRNPSFSSVFLLEPNSALLSSNPAVRIPPSWSFSLGFERNTYTASNSLYYGVLQADGTPPPEWMQFNQNSMTLNGVVPHSNSLPSPSLFSMVLHASDQEGYSAQTQPFDIFIAQHELGLCSTLPTINVTQNTPFDFGVSPDDLAGMCIDEQPITFANITSLLVNTSSCDWLAFDNASRTLSGNPPSDLGIKCLLPITVETSFNQSLQTNMPFAIVESYFSSPSCPTLTIGDDRKVNFNLAQYYSDGSGDATLSAAFSPEGSDYLAFDSSSGMLTGTIPQTSASAIDVTFTAYRNVPHTTSHTTLTISIPSASETKSKESTHPASLSTAVHKKLVLAMGILFGAIGLVCALGAFFALFRRCARIDDTARAHQEAWSDSDKRWYGVVDEEKGYGSSAPDYGALGLGLRRVAERSGSDPIPNVSPGSSQSPGVMRKGEFMTRIRQTVRNVSEKYGSRGSRKTSATRPVIGKPTLIVPDGLAYDDVQSSPNPFDDSNNIRSYPGSAVITNSPSTSTGEHSIPRRRADFAPPRAPTAVHFQDGLVRELSSGSLSSNEEAVVQVASKATSIRSGISHHQPAGPPRPRLVPFTSAARVPVPRVPSLSVQAPSGSPSRRVTSQRAMVLKEDGVNRSPTADELSMGIHYVRSLGGDHDVNPDPSTPSVSTHVRSSFSSLESSHHGHAAAGITRTLVRTGEKFKFRVPVSLYSAASYKKVWKLEAKLMSGKPLPKFLHVDLNGTKHAGAVEFYGAPGARDLGEFNVGVYTVDDGACVGRVVVEVVTASR